SIEAFKKAGRDDLVQREQLELDVLQAYLPAQLTREDIAAEARKIMDETGARSPAAKGKMMPVLMKRIGDRADGRMVNEDVSGLLNNTVEADAAAAAVIVGIIGASLLALYLYLFQPREVNTLARLVMVGLLVFLWVAAAKVFLSVTLPDNDRLYLGYILPVGSAGMLIATLLD